MFQKKRSNSQQPQCPISKLHAIKAALEVIVRIIDFS